MGKDKILVIEQSELMRKFLKEELEQYGFEVIIAINEFDGSIKMKNIVPELIILDYMLAVKTDKVDFFQEKKNSKTVVDVPIIMLAAEVDMKAVINAAKSKVTKIFSKPIKIDTFLNTIGEILNQSIEIDNSPCILDVHINDDIMFIEVGLGLNKEKIASLKYKILELKSMYKRKSIKVLLMMNDITLTQSDINKFYNLIDNIQQSTETPYQAFKILTVSPEIKQIIEKQDKYQKIEVLPDISLAMDSLGQINVENLVSTRDKTASGDLDIVQDQDNKFLKVEKKVYIAIIDDDELILELVDTVLSTMNCQRRVFNKGTTFIESLSEEVPDLIFLDLMMPEMSGFDVMDKLKSLNHQIPIIIFSALSKKETVVKTMQYGVKSYIVKPIDPNVIVNKANEILNSDF
ncbi:MAG: response regulator [Spirochaetes bacterium]|nr:response regulator [Spirochaetota bacterium]